MEVFVHHLLALHTWYPDLRGDILALVSLLQQVERQRQIPLRLGRLQAGPGALCLRRKCKEVEELLAASLPSPPKAQLCFTWASSPPRPHRTHVPSHPAGTRGKVGTDWGWEGWESENQKEEAGGEAGPEGTGQHWGLLTPTAPLTCH